MKILRQNNIDRWGRGEMECQSRNCCDHKQSGYILSKIVDIKNTLIQGTSDVKIFQFALDLITCLLESYVRMWANLVSL